MSSGELVETDEAHLYSLTEECALLFQFFNEIKVIDGKEKETQEQIVC